MHPSTIIALIIAALSALFAALMFDLARRLYHERNALAGENTILRLEKLNLLAQRKMSQQQPEIWQDHRELVVREPCQDRREP